MTEKEWKRIEMAPTWNYQDKESKEFSLNEGDELVGIFLGKEEEVGPNKANLYSFRKEDKTIIAVWGSTLLDTRYKNLMEGEEVKTIYLGTVESEKSGRTYHNYEVFHREVETSKEEIPIREEE